MASDRTPQGGTNSPVQPRRGIFDQSSSSPRLGDNSTEFSPDHKAVVRRSPERKQPEEPRGSRAETRALVTEPSHHRSYTSSGMLSEENQNSKQTPQSMSETSFEERHSKSVAPVDSSSPRRSSMAHDGAPSAVRAGSAASTRGSLLEAVVMSPLKRTKGMHPGQFNH